MNPSPNTTDDKRREELQALAMNIVHQIGDALYEALPKDIAHNYFVDARQATNDVAIDFAMSLIDQYTAQALEAGEQRARDATAKLYEKELQSLRAFQESVIKREQLNIEPQPIRIEVNPKSHTFLTDDATKEKK